jgi:hypothetical protein
MTEMKCHEPRTNNVKKVIQTMQNEKTSSANGSNTAGQSADSSRLSNIFNVMLKSRTPEKTTQDELIDSEREKRGLEKCLPVKKTLGEGDLMKAVPANTGDKEANKTEKPANHDKMLKCIQIAKKFADPTVAYGAEASKAHADQQKSEKIGAVLGREPIKTTEPVKKSANDAWVKLNAMKKKGFEIKDGGLKPNQPVNTIKPIKKSEDKMANWVKLNAMKRKGVEIIPSKGSKIQPDPVKKSDEAIRISQTKTEADLKKPLAKASPTLDYRQINPPKRQIPPPTQTLDYSKDTRPIDSTTGSVKPLNNPYQHSQPKAAITGGSIKPLT